MSLTTQESRFITQLKKSVQVYFIMKKDGFVLSALNI